MLTIQDKENILEWHDLSIQALSETYDDLSISSEEYKEKAASWLITLQKLQKAFLALPRALDN